MKGIKLNLVKREYFESRGYIAEAYKMSHLDQLNDPFMVLNGVDEYRIAISRYGRRPDGRLDWNAHGILTLETTDAALANKIWWNICNRNISYETLEKLFEYEGA